MFAAGGAEGPGALDMEAELLPLEAPERRRELDMRFGDFGDILAPFLRLDQFLVILSFYLLVLSLTNSSNMSA